MSPLIDPEDPWVKRVRELNDQLRRTCEGGRMVLSARVAALSEEVRAKIIQAVKSFENFSWENDPWSTHDWAALEIEGRKIIWRIDYHDINMEYISPDAADPTVTTRVLTILMANEHWTRGSD